MTAVDPIAVRARARRRRTAGWAVLAGLLLLAGAAATVLSWRGDLPDPVASHWGPGGAPDGFAPVGAVLRVLLIGGTALVLLFGAITWGLGQSAITRRVGSGATVGSALFIATVTVGSLYGQRGLTDAHAAGSITGALVVGMVAAVALGVVVGVSVPGDEHQPTTQPVDPGGPRIALTGATTWHGAAASGPAMLIGLVTVLALLAMAIGLRLWVLLGTAGLLAVAIGLLSFAVVEVDRRGVTVRSPLGWPRTRVPLDEVVRADVCDVRPLRDFGGWGWRVGRDGRVGVVLRRGESLLIERTGGRSLVVTVDGAATAAGLVNALADRTR